MSKITTHILELSSGKPASGVNVILYFGVTDFRKKLGEGLTDADGRIKNIIPEDVKIVSGTYCLVFETGSYFKSKNTKTFYPAVTIEFEITDDSHYHVPLLLSPFGYSTYRGS